MEQRKKLRLSFRSSMPNGQLASSQNFPTSLLNGESLLGEGVCYPSRSMDSRMRGAFEMNDMRQTEMQRNGETLLGNGFSFLNGSIATPRGGTQMNNMRNSEMQRFTGGEILNGERGLD